MLAQRGGKGHASGSTHLLEGLQLLHECCHFARFSEVVIAVEPKDWVSAKSKLSLRGGVFREVLSKRFL